MNFFKRLFSRPAETLESGRLETEIKPFIEYINSIFQEGLLPDPIQIYSEIAALNIFTGYLYGALCTLNKSQGSDNLLLVDSSFTNLIYSCFTTAVDREQFFEIEHRSIDQRKNGINPLHEGYCPVKMMNSDLFIAAVRAGVEDYETLLARTSVWKATNLAKILKGNDLCNSRLEEMILAS